MPSTSLEYPILSRFLCVVETSTGMPVNPLAPVPSRAPDDNNSNNDDVATQSLPKGVVLGPDGKPCRTCTDTASWRVLMKSKPSKLSSTSTSTAAAAAAETAAGTASAASLASSLTAACPPDVAALGQSSWTLLHSITATYPIHPSPSLQRETSQFMHTFSKLYPCWTCAEDFQNWLKEDRNAPRVSSREEFGRWMCEAHNAVNVKLGKKTFDCDRWEERWRTGWKDGRCD